MARNFKRVNAANFQDLILVKNFLLRSSCSDRSGYNSDLWPAEMMGFYGTEPTTPIEDNQSVVKRVVCSPDLPIPVYPAVSGAVQQQEPTLQCPVCHKTFTGMTAYQAHQRCHTPTTPKEPGGTDDPYQCNICSKTFAVPARLTRHYRTHTGEKPFQCEFCSKSFSVKENLSVHRRIHTKERPYKCEVCARAFEHSGKLHRHMRIHTGERPHRCNVCDKTFIQSGQLVIHMRTHTGEKPYVCNICSKGFTCSKQLKVHSRTHTGEKPYACDICGKSFGYNHVLKLHQVAHYGEKVYKCTICNETFNSKKCMEAHIKSHSDNTPVRSPEQTNGGSDKENGSAQPPLITYDRCYPTSNRMYGYNSPIHDYPQYSPTSGVELLAAAAVSAAVADERRSSDEVLQLIASSQEALAVLRRPVYNNPQPAAIDRADDIRRRVEEALAVAADVTEPILTPPNSNPDSPELSPSTSPQPVTAEAIVLSLPPRKRSKMILKSMERDITTAVRYSTVIQYAKAS